MIVRRCWRGRGYAKHIVLATTWPLLSSCRTSSHLSFLDPQGPVADMQRLHFLEVLGLLAIFVALPIFLVTPWFAWRYRYGASPRHEPKWRFYTPLDIACWAGPMVIVALLGALLWGSTHALDPYRPLVSNQPTLRVQVIGYDWKWLFIYPDEGVASIGELAMPVGRPVAMQLTSATVMQSLQVPALGSQIYAMGGMVTQLQLEASKPGRFMGENTMYNGDGFSQQKFTAVAMTADEFQAWVRNVRYCGVPLDAAALNAISQRTTRAQLIAAMGHAKSNDGNLYFSGATAALFPAVVKATMDGTAVRPAAVGDEAAAAAVSAARAPAAPLSERRP
jgi:cytochrome o ubiquinol oxidase subunit II